MFIKRQLVLFYFHLSGDHMLVSLFIIRWFVGRDKYRMLVKARIPRIASVWLGGQLLVPQRQNGWWDLLKYRGTPSVKVPLDASQRPVSLWWSLKVISMNIFSSLLGLPMVSIENWKLTKDVCKINQLNKVHVMQNFFGLLHSEMTLPSGRLAKHKIRANGNENLGCNFRQVLVI